MSDYLIETISLQIVLIDAQEIFLAGTIEMLHSRYPKVKILTARTPLEALNLISNYQPDLVIMDISLPEKPGASANTRIGIQFLNTLLEKYPKLNIFVQSAYIKTLVRIKTKIDAHQGGLIVAEKNLSGQEMLDRVKWALEGLIHTKDIKELSPEVKIKPEWLRLLTLAFHEGLQDKAIARDICVSERMVRYYWYRLQIALGIDSEDIKNQGKNIRIVTQIRAREAGLID